MELRRSALVAHSAEHIFDLIEAAEDYPEFLPWCSGATILARDDAMVAAEIAVNWHGVRFSFTTRNPKRRPTWLAVMLERGPFRRFEGEWNLTPLAADACKIEFMLRYDFQNAIARSLTGKVFDEIARTLVDAFVARADKLYGG